MPHRMCVGQAVAYASGVRENRWEDAVVKLVRREGRTENVSRLKLADVLLGKMPDYYMQPEDMVFVELTERMADRLPLQIEESPRQDEQGEYMVAVAGESPIRGTIKDGRLTVVQALTTARLSMDKPGEMCVKLIRNGASAELDVAGILAGKKANRFVQVGDKLQVEYLP